MSERFKPTVFVDVRESLVVKQKLVELECRVIEKTLSLADYVVSVDHAVERKKVNDFFQSIFDGRLFEQIERLGKAYLHPCLLVEGDVTGTIDAMSNPSVFWGALARVMADHTISIIFTPDEKSTAIFLCRLATKLQGEKERNIIVKHKPKIYTLKQRQLLAVQSLPKIGLGRAEMLLRTFGSVRRVFQASREELLSVEGLGEKTVTGMLDLLDTKYPGLDPNS